MSILACGSPPPPKKNLSAPLLARNSACIIICSAYFIYKQNVNFCLESVISISARRCKEHGLILISGCVYVYAVRAREATSHRHSLGLQNRLLYICMQDLHSSNVSSRISSCVSCGYSWHVSFVQAPTSLTLSTQNSSSFTYAIFMLFITCIFL
jgi:hypothetical protein